MKNKNPHVIEFKLDLQYGTDIDLPDIESLGRLASTEMKQNAIPFLLSLIFSSTQRLTWELRNAILVVQIAIKLY